MNTETAIDLADLLDAMEHLHKMLPKLTLKTKVDVAARLKAIVKTAKSIDDDVKDEIKDHLKGKAGTVPGEIFKALVGIHPVTRLDQKLLKEERPKIYAEYEKTGDEERVTFETR
jgi:predicted phage-related endonuclease